MEPCLRHSVVPDAFTDLALGTLASYVMETCHVELTDCGTGLCADFPGK
jgi:hypothetical protein